jgi:hypothetical protein
MAGYLIQNNAVLSIDFIQAFVVQMIVDFSSTIVMHSFKVLEVAAGQRGYILQQVFLRNQYKH